MISFVVFKYTENGRNKALNRVGKIRFAITTNSDYVPLGTGNPTKPGQVRRAECNIFGKKYMDNGREKQISYYEDNLLGVGFVYFVYLKLLYALKLIK